ncbi:hypothetical protein DXT90_18220 [Agrobacterium tumefaciens]|nr:hypothetical protein [Agrobacterium tumefaciens]
MEIDDSKKNAPLSSLSYQEQLAVYSSLPTMGSDPKNTGGSVTQMIERVSEFSLRESFVSVLNARHHCD